MTTRRAFLAGAGALAVTPLLPPVPAGEWLTATAAKEAGASLALDAAWTSGGMSAITNTTYHIWAVRTASGALDMMAIPKGKRAPNGFRRVARMGSIVRGTLSERTKKAS